MESCRRRIVSGEERLDPRRHGVHRRCIFAAFLFFRIYSYCFSVRPALSCPDIDTDLHFQRHWIASDMVQKMDGYKLILQSDETLSLYYLRQQGSHKFKIKEHLPRWEWREQSFRRCCLFMNLSRIQISSHCKWLTDGTLVVTVSVSKSFAFCTKQAACVVTLTVLKHTRVCNFYIALQCGSESVWDWDQLSIDHFKMFVIHC